MYIYPLSKYISNSMAWCGHVMGKNESHITKGVV
jgi:hypothetical protein